MAGIDLHWLPLGAGGSFVKFNGRVYESLAAVLARRRPLDIYHAALDIRLPEGDFTVELTPVPDGNGQARGVVGEGCVGTRAAGRFRIFRYEVRRWPNGIIPDLEFAVDGPIQVTGDEGQTRLAFDLLSSVPTPVWGRDDLGLGEMWNSNSVISWLIAAAGLLGDHVRVPEGGRAPGWAAGVRLAERGFRG